MKAITPVVALVMLMLITVGMVGSAQVWFGSMMTASTEKTIAIPPGGAYCQDNKITVIVQNTGATSTLTDEDVTLMELDGTDVRHSLFFGDFDRTGLVGYWRFEPEAQYVSGSTRTHDYAGVNDGTLVGAAQLDNGMYGKAMKLDGSGDYVNVETDSSLKLTKFTIESWVYLSENVFGMYLGRGYNVAGGLSIGSHSGVTSAWWGMLPGSSEISWGTKTYGRWVHLVVTYDPSLPSGNIGKYENGLNRGTNSYTAPLMSNSYPTRIGSDPIISFDWKGSIDEVRIWNRVLLPDEVSRLNKTNSGAFSLAPGSAKAVLTKYPVFASGRHDVRIGTRSGVVTSTIQCA